MGFPFVKPGDEVTIDLISGAGVHGILQVVELASEFQLGCMVIRLDKQSVEHGDLVIAGNQIRAWRTGGPIVEQVRASDNRLAVGVPMPGMPMPPRGRG